MTASRRQKLLVYEAHYYWDLGQPDSAFNTLEAAHKTDPAEPVTLCLAAQWSLTLGRVDAARRYYAQAVDTAAHSPRDYHSLLGSVAVKLAQAGAHAAP